MAVRMITLNGDTPESWRLALSLFGHPSAAAIIDRRGGLAPGGSMTPGASPAWLGAGDTAMTGVIAPFIAWVDGTSGTSQGGYIVHNNGWLPVSFQPGEPAVARTDRIVIQVRDDAYDSSGSSDARVLVLKGNSGGGAADMPASSELLWEVAVPAGASIGGGGFNMDGVGVRTDRRRWVASNGGLLLVRDAADRGTIAPHEGMAIYRLDAGDRQVYRGGTWAWDGIPRVSQKFAPQNIAGTGWTSDNAVSVSVPAGGYFDFEFHGNYAADTDFDLKVKFAGPAGSGATWMILGKGGTSQPDGGLGQVDWITQDITGEPRLGGRLTTDTTSPMSFLVKGTLYSGSGGTVTPQYGQEANGAPSQVLPGGRLTLTRIGND